MRVLLIADNGAPTQSMESLLKSESIKVHTAHLGETGVDLEKLSDYDIILLDLNVTDLSGLSALPSLRFSSGKTPNLVLFAGFPDIDDKIKNLGLGFGDYMIKPVHKDELVARMNAIVRRARVPVRPVVKIGDLAINLERKTVYFAGSRVYITGKEFEVLELLCLRRGTTLTKEMFLSHLYGGMDEPNVKIIDVFVCNLRKKLANASNGKTYIETVWGRGYMLRESSEDDAQISAVQPPRLASMR